MGGVCARILTGLVATNGTADFVCMAVAKFSEKTPKLFGIRVLCGVFFFKKNEKNSRLRRILHGTSLSFEAYALCRIFEDLRHIGHRHA